MSMVVLALLLFILSILVLVKSADIVLKSVKRLAVSFQVSEVAITILGLSILASLPELFVSLFGSVSRHSEIALGTVIGSNTFTLLFVLGISALIRPFHIKRMIEERDSTWMLLGGALIFLFLNKGINRWEGALLLLLYLPYLYSVYKSERRITTPILHKISKEKEIMKLTGSVILILISAEVVVRSGIYLAQTFHLSKLIISLIFIGIGSSIPETTIGIASALKKKTSITLGDVYGTNIFTLFFILGISALIYPIPASSQVSSFILPYFIFSTIILQLFMTTGHRVQRVEGILLILFYIYFALANLNILPKP